MTTPSETDRVTIVGAGLAGSLLAVYLAKHGHRLTIYERRPDLRRGALTGGRSINLALANRGIRALEAVGLMDRIRPLMIPMAGRMIHEAGGSLRFLPYGSRPHEVIYSASRGGLTAILLDAAEETGRAEIHFGHTCTGVDFEKRTVSLAVEETGEIVTRPFEVVIGTDGSASAVRSAMLATRGGTYREEPLGHSYKELTIPPGPNGGFQMEVHALHIWPRGEFMLIALPNTDGSFTVTLFLPNDGEQSFANLTSETAVLRFFESLFPDALRLIPSLVDDFFTNPTGHLGTVRCNPWHTGGNALILGDAAHAVVPFHGQGMNCAFEDCFALDAAIGQGDRSWAEVFQAFEVDRKPNADAIADMAIENYLEMRSSVLDPRFLLRKEISFRLESLYPDRFIPRYSMVMFHHIPYAEARRRGEVQEGILNEVAAHCRHADEVDYEQAGRLIATRLDRVRSP